MYYTFMYYIIRCIYSYLCLFVFVRKGCREDLLPCNLHSCVKVKGSHGLGHFHTTHVLEKHTEKNNGKIYYNNNTSNKSPEKS